MQVRACSGHAVGRLSFSAQPPRPQHESRLWATSERPPKVWHRRRRRRYATEELIARSRDARPPFIHYGAGEITWRGSVLPRGKLCAAQRRGSVAGAPSRCWAPRPLQHGA